MILPILHRGPEARGQFGKTQQRFTIALFSEDGGKETKKLSPNEIKKEWTLRGSISDEKLATLKKGDEIANQKDPSTVAVVEEVPKYAAGFLFHVF